MQFKLFDMVDNENVVEEFIAENLEKYEEFLFDLADDDDNRKLFLQSRKRSWEKFLESRMEEHEGNYYNNDGE